MSQQIKLLDYIEPIGSAKYSGNWKGLFLPTKKIFDWPCVADLDEGDWLSTTGANGLTLTHAATDGGEELMTLGATEDDCGELYHIAHWSAASNCGMLAKVKISRITNVNVCVGMVDQYEHLNDHVAMEISGTAAYAATNTKDFAGLVFDTDADTDVWYCTFSENGTEGTPIAATGSLAPVAATYFYAGVQTNTSGDVDYLYGTTWDNISVVAHKADAIAAASTDLLSPYVGFISRTTSAATCNISRIITWQDN